MTKFLKYGMLVMLSITLVFTGCKEDTDTFDASQELQNYLVENSMDLSLIILNDDGKFVTAATQDIDLSGKYIMDIRSADAFGIGHIADAVNVAFVDILTAATQADKPILVVCYSGQTACYATSLLRLYGYSDAQALKWGMSGWNSDFDGWTAKVGNEADGHANWTTDAAPTNLVFDNPTISSSLADGAGILKERVEAVVAAGFKTVSGTDALNNPGTYFINNYFSETDYLGFGHIDGAKRVLPLLISDGTINNLDPNAKVVTYCYTGQTSAVVTAYLNVLGYEAYSMTYGMNGIFNDNTAWVKNRWNDGIPLDNATE